MRIGMVGSAGIGRQVALRLRAAGHPLRIWTGPLESRDGIEAPAVASPADAATGADITVLCLPAGCRLEDVLAGPSGITGAMAPGAVVVDHGPTPLPDTQTAAAALTATGALWLDAPLVTLERPTLAVGGPPQALDHLQPYLDALGMRGIVVGPTGSGQWLRLMEGIIAAITLQGACEGLDLALAGGLGLDHLMRVLRAGSGDSTMVREVARAIQTGAGADTWDPWPPSLAEALAAASPWGDGLPATSLTLALCREHVRRGTSPAAMVTAHA